MLYSAILQLVERLPLASLPSQLGSRPRFRVVTLYPFPYRRSPDPAAAQDRRQRDDDDCGGEA